MFPVKPFFFLYLLLSGSCRLLQCSSRFIFLGKLCPQYRRGHISPSAIFTPMDLFAGAGFWQAVRNKTSVIPQGARPELKKYFFHLKPPFIMFVSALFSCGNPSVAVQHAVLINHTYYCFMPANAIRQQDFLPCS